jgi:stage II sporulation protein AA (anti-sigma F factor antagonist)
MDLDLEYKQGTLFVRPQGELDLSVTDDFRKILEDNLKKHPIDHLVFNLSQVSFLDSSGLGVILGRYKRLAQQGGRVSLVGPQPQVHRILTLSGLLTVMAEYVSEEEAMAKAEQGGKRNG